MGYINFKYLYSKDLTDEEYLILQKVIQRDLHLLENQDYTNLLEKGYVRLIKTGKTELDRLRISKKGKELLAASQHHESQEGILDLAEDLIDLFDSYSKEYGNKQRIVENLNWYITKSDFTMDLIKESVEDWLTNGWNMWLENILWDKKKASVFTTLKSRELSQSPLYEFMRRKYNLKW